MRKVRTYVFCDQCKAGHRRDALVTCEIHSVDLCKVHIRQHFDQAVCRLVPTDRELSSLEEMAQRLFRDRSL